VANTSASCDQAPDDIVVTARLVVLASGNGSNFQAILDATRSEPRLEADVVGVVCNVPGAFVLDRARAGHVPTQVLAALPGEPRTEYDSRLLEAVRPLQPDYVVLAGWMRLLSMTFLSAFPQRVVNLHPALPGQFPGTHAIERALRAAHEDGLEHTGVMVHFVPDEGVDDGPVIATATVAIDADDTLESLSERVHATERALLADALRTIVTTPR
jgi:phosphoribosylglycinamide formyltransferase-1